MKEVSDLGYGGRESREDSINRPGTVIWWNECVCYEVELARVYF